LIRGEKLSGLDALKRFGCFRLGARVWDLKKDGYHIDKYFETKRGKTFAVYFMPNVI
jgi:hypothetical protein